MTVLQGVHEMAFEAPLPLSCHDVLGTNEQSINSRSLKLIFCKSRTFDIPCHVPWVQPAALGTYISCSGVKGMINGFGNFTTSWNNFTTHTGR